MAKYTFGIPWCYANAIRSWRTDTLVASTALRVMNAQGGLHHDYPAQPAMKLGDFREDTVVNTNLFFLDVDVPGPTSSLPDGGAISWSFILANAGQVNLDLLVTALNNAAAGIVGALVSSGNGWAELVAGGIIGTQDLLQLLTAGCDGPVAALALNLTAAELAQMTNDPGNWAQMTNCPGTDSPHGCGGNSNYDVHYVIANRSQITVPNLSRMSPAAAKGVVQRAGLVFSSTTQRTGSPRQAPVVEGQEPAPGSLVLPGTGVQAIIIEPAPHGHPVP